MRTLCLLYNGKILPTNVASVKNELDKKANAPTRMIKGRIYPPKFKIENEKTVKRHINQ